MFEEWYKRNGKISKQPSEPSQWRFEVNQLDVFCSRGFNFVGDLKIRELFYASGKKELIEHGIDKYGDEEVIIFNPDRPVYWIQVTIREVFDLLIENRRSLESKIVSETIVKVYQDEYASFTEAERNGFAYFGNSESISRIGTDNQQLQVMRPNPAYWNKNLPRSDIQFMVLEIPGTEVVKRKMAGCLKAADGYYYVYRLLNELNINDLKSVIK